MISLCSAAFAVALILSLVVLRRHLVDNGKIKQPYPLQVKLLHPEAKLPARANSTDAGLDLCSVGSYTIPAGCRQMIDTGIAISIPDGYVARIAPRSGLAVKSGIDTLAGVVDSSYRGEVKVILLNTGKDDFQVNAGDKIAQMLIQEVMLWTPEVVDDLDATARGNKGFGSSGQ